ncbi:class I adenylate-forming enzyme family protein [Streptomyces canus]|uniref:class I adenylate-forming enzyme family protein n=1 Tax=Streptomyces canus TaxID=58343 RepID=UPI0027847E32|nr:class I adenylate-forming enzyme family protein [Streptomyces canus]MDQ0758974.1 long-chain acyl-CoA synthetase [Streptomyces canus]
MTSPPATARDPRSHSTVPRLVGEYIRERPRHVALVVDGRRSLTLGDWDTAATSLARGLHARGVRRGDRVAVLCPPGGWWDHAVATLALHRLGAAAVPLPPGLPAGEAGRRMAHCGVVGLIRPSGAHESCPGGWTDTLGELTRRSGGAAPADEAFPGDVADILHTSGTTTGRAKPVAVTHANLTHGRAARGRFTADAPHVLCAVPVGTNAAHSALMMALTSPATVHVLSAPDPETAAEAAAGLGTATVVLPPHAVRHWAATDITRQHDLAGLAALMVGSGPVAPASVARLHRVLPQARILAGYGSTESAPAFLNNPLPTGYLSGLTPSARSAVSLGSPADGTEVMVTDETGSPVGAGERGWIHLRHPAPRRSYVALPEEEAHTFRPDGWTRTGDLGHIDGEGKVHFFDRAAHVLVRDGHTLSSSELENTLLWLPEVVEAAVFALPPADEQGNGRGQIVAAATVNGPVHEGRLRERMEDMLAREDRPDRLVVLDTLPRGDLGKVLKWRLARECADRAL